MPPHPLRIFIGPRRRQKTRQAPIPLMPVNRRADRAEPTDVGQRRAVDRFAVEELPAADGRLLAAEVDQRLAESQQVLVPFDQTPVEPRYLVVLAVGIVVAALSASALVTGQQHRHALAE